MAQNWINFKKSIFTASGLFTSISKAKKRNTSRVKSLEEPFFPIKQRFRKDAAPSNINPCLRTAINNNKKLISTQQLKHKGYMSFTNTQTHRWGIWMPRFWLLASYRQLIKFLEDVVPLLGAHTDLSAPTSRWGRLRHSLQVITSHLRGSNRPASLPEVIFHFFTFSLCMLVSNDALLR